MSPAASKALTLWAASRSPSEPGPGARRPRRAGRSRRPGRSGGMGASMVCPAHALAAAPPPMRWRLPCDSLSHALLRAAPVVAPAVGAQGSCAGGPLAPPPNRAGARRSAAAARAARGPGPGQHLPPTAQDAPAPFAASGFRARGPTACVQVVHAHAATRCRLPLSRLRRARVHCEPLPRYLAALACLVWGCTRKPLVPGAVGPRRSGAAGRPRGQGQRPAGCAACGCGARPPTLFACHDRHSNQQTTNPCIGACPSSRFRRCSAPHST